MCLPCRASPSRERWRQPLIMRWPSLLARRARRVSPVLLEAGHGHGFAMADAAAAPVAGAAPSRLWRLARRADAAPHRGAGRPHAHGRGRRAPLRNARVDLRGSACRNRALSRAWCSRGASRGLTGTAYGGVLLTKAAIFALLLAFAAVNRLRLTPALDGPDAETARRALASSIAAETVLGLLVVLAASVLSSLEPGMHMASG